MMRRCCILLLALAPLWIVRAAAEPLQIELKDGSTLKGEVVAKSPEAVTLKTVLGDQVIRRDQLSEKSITDLNLPSADDPAYLRARIAELEKRVEELEAENRHLRQQAANTTSSRPTASSSKSDAAQTSAASTKAKPQGGGYWISSGGKRHNSACRYFKTSEGREGTATEGTACKVCGG